MGSLGFALGLILSCWVHEGAPFVSLGSSGVVGSTRVMTGGRWVHPVSLSSLGGALGVVDVVVGFIGFGPWSSLVHPCSWRSLEFSLGIFGFI